MGSSRGRKRLGMVLAGAVLSIVVSAHETGGESAEGQAVAGRIVTEMLMVESLGKFRGMARLLFFLAAVNDSPEGERR